MYENMEAMLEAQYPKLYLDIKQKNTDELNLSIDVGDTIVGFGRVLDFYMFWIREKRGELYFAARKEFTRVRKNNVVKIEFIEENQAAIFDAIDRIYNSYLQSFDNGRFQSEVERIEAKKRSYEIKKEKKEYTPEIMMVWNDVTVLSLEGLEGHCCTDSMDVAMSMQYKEQGRLVATLFDEIFQIMKAQSYGSKSRNLSIYWEHIQSDRTTLAQIAARYDVSRERIRQIINRVDRFLFKYFKNIMLYDDEDINDRIKQMADALQAVEYNVVDLEAYGMTHVSNRKKQAIFNMLFGQVCSQEIVEKSKRRSILSQEVCPIVPKKRRSFGDWEFYRSKICYPSQLVTSNAAFVDCYEENKKIELEKRIYKNLNGFEEILQIIESPDIVYYSTNQTDHRPHFLLRLLDGTSVLVLGLQVINMAFIYNIERCNAFHRFCKENGYGYLIIDDRGNSIYDIKNRVVDPKLVEHLDSILNNQAMIVWENIKLIKQMQFVSNADIAAYVLQNKLHFTMKPFCIKRRKTIQEQMGI